MKYRTFSIYVGTNEAEWVSSHVKSEVYACDFFYFDRSGNVSLWWQEFSLVVGTPLHHLQYLLSFS